MKDRRSRRRYEPDTPLDARLKSSVPATVRDISTTGAQLEVQRSLRPNLPCEFRIVRADGDITFKGIVRRCRVWGFGVDESGERVVIYRAGVEFAEEPDIIARLGLGSSDAVPRIAEADETPAAAPPEAKPKRTGPIKIRFDTSRLRKAFGGKGDD